VECQEEVAVKIRAAVQEHAGTERSASTVKMWNEAQQRIMECVEKPRPTVAQQASTTP
jgi:hypothetical protein